MLCGVKNGDEVILPALTFVATANAISYNSAVPHFVDCEKTLGIDVNKLSEYLSSITIKKNGNSVNKYTGRIIKAIIPVHTFGHPIQIDGLIEVSKKFNLKIVEDVNRIHWKFYKSKHTGTFEILVF